MTSISNFEFWKQNKVAKLVSRLLHLAKKLHYGSHVRVQNIFCTWLALLGCIKSAGHFQLRLDALYGGTQESAGKFPTLSATS